MYHINTENENELDDARGTVAYLTGEITRLLGRVASLRASLDEATTSVDLLEKKSSLALDTTTD